MIEQNKNAFRVVRDQCGDPMLNCRPTSIPAELYDDGPCSFWLYVLQTRRPVATANAMVRMLASHGIKACRVQTGDCEVSLRIFHGGDLKRGTKILELLNARRRRKLSVSHKRRLVEAGKAFRFSKADGSGDCLPLPESKRNNHTLVRDGRKGF